MIIRIQFRRIIFVLFCGSLPFYEVLFLQTQPVLTRFYQMAINKQSEIILQGVITRLFRARFVLHLIFFFYTKPSSHELNLF